MTEGIGIKHLRLVIGNSMGGMHAWIWGDTYPDFMDALVPMASQPTPMASRNWMMRRHDHRHRSATTRTGTSGNYTTQPQACGWRRCSTASRTNGGTLRLQKLAPTREAADKLLDERLAAPFTADANDFIYQWDASRDYDPTPASGTHHGARCWRSTPPTTSATRPRPASWKRD